MSNSIRQQQGWRPSGRLAAGALLTLALGAGFVGGRATVRAADDGPTPAREVQAVDRSAALPSYSSIVEKVAPAIATIRVETTAASTPTMLPEPFRRFFGEEFGGVPTPRRRAGLGSGVIIQADGYILTNNHVIDGAERIHVDLADGRSLQAEVVGTDPPSDLAVLRVEAEGLPTVPFGDSDEIRVGDVVLAFGNPMGVGQTVTMGIVSAKGRATGVGDGSYEDFLQTDAPINQGNSGGALVDSNGQLIGINAQILSPTGGNVGLGFAIPVDMARAVADQLMTDGVVRRGRLGVVVQTLTSDLAAGLGIDRTRGALVSDVEEGSPAAEAGLRAGDVVIEVNGRAVADSNALRNDIASYLPGTEVTLTVLRDGDRQQVTAELGGRQEEGQRASNQRPGNQQGSSGFGLSVQPLTPDLARQAGVPASTEGLLVMQVSPGSAAANAGIRTGDVITRVGGTDVSTVAELRSTLEGASADRPVLLLVNREGANIFVALTKDAS